MKVALVLFTIGVLLLPSVTEAQETPANPSQSRGLTIDLVAKLVQAGIPPERVVELIQETPSYFDLSLQTIENLRNAGVPAIVLDAMLKSRSKGPGAPQSPPTPSPANTSGNPPPPTNIHPIPVSPGSGGSGSGRSGGTGSTGGNSSSQVPPHSPIRLRQAKAAQIPAAAWSPPAKQPDPGCPISKTFSKPGKLHKVYLDYDTGSSSASRLGSSGQYCFALGNANPLYDWAIILNVVEPTGNPFDLLNDAIQTLTKLSTGASSTKPPTPNPNARNACSALDLKDVTAAATTLKQSLAAMVPDKDSSGKVGYIPLKTTLDKWDPIPEAFNSFKTEVIRLQSELPDSSDTEGCDADLLAQAESVILDDYLKVSAEVQDLAMKLSRPSVQYYERALEGTVAADLVATPSYAGTADGSKTFHFDPSFGILSSSAGFLLTRLQTRSYASATAPDPSDMTKTQNVLRVDYGAGIRPALVALLTGNVPQVNSRNFGLGISAGPVFDITNGKADTSRFGIFGGLSFRFTPWVFLTPGVHFGEFADFPQGFSHSGQVIPANTGTPTPVKRYTARFAFGITFKLKDLGAPTGTGQAKTQQGGSSPQSTAATGSNQ